MKSNEATVSIRTQGPIAAPSSSLWRQMAFRRARFDDQRKEVLAMASGQSVGQRAGYPGAETTSQTSRKEILSPAPQRTEICSSRHRHRQTGQLWRNETRNSGQR